MKEVEIFIAAVACLMTLTGLVSTAIAVYVLLTVRASLAELELKISARFEEFVTRMETRDKEMRSWVENGYTLNSTTNLRNIQLEKDMQDNRSCIQRLETRMNAFGVPA